MDVRETSCWWLFLQGALRPCSGVAGLECNLPICCCGKSTGSGIRSWAYPLAVASRLVQTQEGKKEAVEVMWETHEEFASSMAHMWQQQEKATTLHGLHDKLVTGAKGLTGWGRTIFGHISLELKKLNEELAKLQAEPSRLGPSHAEIKITDRIVELNHHEEIMWQQRSRIRRLSAGDKNTRFFHLRVSQ